MRILKPSKTITVEFTEEEATILCALVGGTAWNFDTQAGQTLYDFFTCVDGALPDREASFADYFEGEVRMKP